MRVIPPSKVTEFNLQALQRLASEETPSKALMLSWGQAENSRRLAALDAAGRQQALLAYCRIIEEVGLLVAGNTRPAPDEERRLHSAIDQLKAALSKRSSTEKQVTAVHRAYSDLGKIQARFSGTRITLAASQLGLDKRTADRAAKYWNLRSRGVAHPGQLNIGADDVDAARRVAWDYCTTYLRARWATSHPTPSLEEIGNETQSPS
jgi:hypothetical protein